MARRNYYGKLKGSSRVHGGGYKWEGCGNPYKKGKKRKQTKEEFLTIPFGKYKGQNAADVAKTDPSYIRWFVEKCDMPFNKKPDCIIWAYTNVLNHK